MIGGEAYLKQRGVEVVNLQSKECQDLMDRFIKENPEIWYAIALILLGAAAENW